MHWILDSLSAKSGFRIPIVSEIPDSLSCLPDSKAQDSGCHRQKFPAVSGIRIPFMGREQATLVGPGWGHSRKVWVELCRRGLQTPTLFKTKIAHFASLFNTGDTTFWSWFFLFCIQNSLIFHTKIVEIDIEKNSYWYFKCRPLIASLHTLWKASSPKRPHPVQDA